MKREAVLGKLAASLRITEETFRQWRMKPDCPKSLVLADWVAWRAKQKPTTLAWGSDPTGDTIAERRAREEVRGLQLVNDAREKRHMLEAERFADDVVDRAMAKIRAALFGAFPGKLAEAMVPGLSTDQRESLIRLHMEDVMRDLG